jgi:glutamine synthetase
VNDRPDAEATMKDNLAASLTDRIDKNLYDLPPEELKKVPLAPGSLEEALDVSGSSTKRTNDAL